MPYRLLKHGKEHIGVINLHFKLDSLKHEVGLKQTRLWKAWNGGEGLDMTPFDIEPVSFINIVEVIFINSVLYLLSHFCHSSHPLSLRFFFFFALLIMFWEGRECVWANMGEIFVDLRMSLKAYGQGFVCVFFSTRCWQCQGRVRLDMTLSQSVRVPSVSWDCQHQVAFL